MVLGHSLKDRGVRAPLVAFVVVDKLSSDTITELRVRIALSRFVQSSPLITADRL